MTTKRSDLSEGWPASNDFRKSIQLEFSVFVTLMILLLMVISGYSITKKLVRITSEHIARELLVQARSASGTASNHILSGSHTDGLILNSLCNQLTADNPDIYWVGVSDPSDTYIAHTDIKQVVAKASSKLRCGDQFGELLKGEECLRRDDDTIFVSVPIVEDEVRLGCLSIASSAARISEARVNAIMTVASITMIFVLIGLPVTLVLLRRKLKPVKLITRSLKEIDFENLRIDIPFNSRNEFGYLAETLHVMGSKLNQAREESIEKQRMHHELEIAHEIQASILPKEYPKSSNFEFAGEYRSAKEVGGDYYDFFPIDKDRLAFVVADVSGKSLPGMLVMLLVRDIVKRLAVIEIEQPAEVLTAVNSELFGSIREGMFVTMFLGILNKRTGHLAYASAGHSSIVHINGETGESRLVKSKGFPLGLVETDMFVARIERPSLQLAPNDLVVLYTDGVNEAKNSEGIQFGMDRFLELLSTKSKSSAEDIVSYVSENLVRFVGDEPMYDDTTLVVLKWKCEENSDSSHYLQEEECQHTV